MKTIEIFFSPTELLDPRNQGSTIEIGQKLSGQMQLSNSCVFWEDINGQQWAFWIGDTAKLIEIKSKGKEADLYRFFLNLKTEHNYLGGCNETEIKDFCKINKFNFDLLQDELKNSKNGSVNNLSEETMKINSKIFPNGIASYLETHCLISIALGKLIESEEGFAWQRYINQGSGGLYELAEELTDEFEEINKNEEWIDKDYLEEVDFFLENKNIEKQNINDIKK